MELTPGGTIRVDPQTLATSAPGVFAGGDVAFGPRNLIEAVANGKRAARSIHELLAQDRAQLEVTLDVEKIPTRDYRMLAGFEILDRETPPTLDLGRRTGIAEVETGLRRRRRPAARPRAAWSATCRPSTTPRSACSAAAAWTSARSTAWPSCRSSPSSCPKPSATRARRAGRGERPPALGHDQGRRPLHPLRPLRRPLSHRRHDHGALPDPGALRPPASVAPSTGDAHERTEERPPRLPGEARHRRGRASGIGDAGGRLAALAAARTSPTTRPTTVKLGLPTDFPDGMKFLPEQRLFVFREGKIFHAVSAVCTHLGLHGPRRGAAPAGDGGRWAARRCALTHRFACPVPRLEVHGRRQGRRGTGAASRWPGST